MKKKPSKRRDDIEQAFIAGSKFGKKRGLLTSDQLSMLNVSMMAVCISVILDQYTWSAFPKKMRDLAGKIEKDVHNLERLADEMAEYELEDV